MSLVMLWTTGISTALRGIQHVGMSAGRLKQPGFPLSQLLILLQRELLYQWNQNIWTVFSTVWKQTNYTKRGRVRNQRITSQMQCYSWDCTHIAVARLFTQCLFLMLQYPSEQQCNSAQQTGQLNKLTKPGSTWGGFVTSVGQSLGAPFARYCAGSCEEALGKSLLHARALWRQKYRSKG